MVEVYVDDFTSLATLTSNEQLVHVVNAIMTGIHDLFPVDNDDSNDPLSLKNIFKLESMWALHDDILGFEFMVSKRQYGWRTQNATRCSQF